MVETMRMSNELRVDPLDYVEGLESPIGVYLRREVFGKRRGDATLRKDLHGKIASKQSDDGSWDWLLTTQRHTYHDQPGFFHSSNRRDPSLMRETSYGEFGPGCTIFYQTAYAVHLFHVLGLDDKKQVQRTVKSYLKFWTPDWCGAWCTVNVLRVLIEHPLSARTKRVKEGLKYLAGRQTKTGAWKSYPFYHTFHALSRASFSVAKKQLENALPSVVRRQNKDGSWGKKDQETETYLILDALKNIGAL